MNQHFTLTHWGAYLIGADPDNTLRLDPLPEDPDPSPIGQSIAGALNDKLRIQTPMVRAGYLQRGPAARESRVLEPFVPVSWERASQLVADEIARVAGQHGNAAIFGGSYGWASAGRFHHAQSQLHRFLNLCGGYTRSVNTHSYAAAEVLLPHVIGSHNGLDAHHTTWGVIARHTGLFVAFGGVPLKNAQVSAGGVGHHTLRPTLRACHENGVAFVNISPLRDDIDAAFDPDWIAVRPNTDTAMMLGLAHTLVAEGLHDTMFLSRCTFWQLGQTRLPSAPDEVLLEAFRADPQANRLRTPSGRIEIASERVASFGYADCPGHPAWLEPAEWLGAPQAASFPLHLISNQPRTRLHSQYDHGTVSRASKVGGREPLSLHPDDAARRGIISGDIVRVFSPRGQCLAGAIVTDAIMRGCVQLATGAWWDPEGRTQAASLDRHGNANVLTIDRGTSRLAQGPIAHTTLVEVERYAGDAPAVGAFVPPSIQAASD